MECEMEVVAKEMAGRFDDDQLADLANHIYQILEGRSLKAGPPPKVEVMYFEKKQDGAWTIENLDDNYKPKW